MAISEFFRQIATGDQVKDFSHASKTFVSDNLRLSPKMAFQYHVFFDGNSNLLSNGNVENIELGILAKEVRLPSFEIELKEYNAYNRVNLVQTKLKYRPVEIILHDDGGNVVRNFWKQYQQHYYWDSTNGEAVVLSEHKYKERITDKWGLSAKENSYDSANVLSAIRIYQLYQRKFIEYTLVNPLITSWTLPNLNSAESTPLTHQVSIQYETVLMSEGFIAGDNVKGFSVIHYDNSPSPLNPGGGGTSSIFGPGGLIDSVDNISQDLLQGDFVGALLKTSRAYNKLNGKNLGRMAIGEAATNVKNIILGKESPGRMNFPGVSSTTPGIRNSINNSISNATNNIGGRVNSAIGNAVSGARNLFNSFGRKP